MNILRQSSRVSVSLLVEARLKDKSDMLRLTRMRSRVDIMAAILNEAVEDTRKTRIMYKCNLSHRQLQSYLKLLLGMGMLRSFLEGEDSESKFFETTQKGKEFLSAYRTLKALMSSSSML